MARTLSFTKMQATGNDYVYVWLPTNVVDDPAKTSVALSKPHIGIGSDGLILIDKASGDADFSMRIFNSDGSEAQMCGNGIRCVARYLYDHQLTRQTQLRIATRSGVRHVRLHLDPASRNVASVSVDMGQPQLLGAPQVSLPGATLVSMGNPHCVCLVDDATLVALESEGPRLEHEAMGDGRRCNVEFVSPLPEGQLRMRVWERGSGVTQSCGTGACAALVAAHNAGLVQRTAHIITDGGRLTVSWHPDNHVWLEGPAETVFEGTISI